MSGIIGSVGAKALMKTEIVILDTSDFRVMDLDAADSANIVTQAYVEKYSAVITPSAWMQLYGVNAVLVVEYIVKTDPGAGTVTVQTLVDGVDAVEKTLLNIAAGVQTAVHTDIIEAPLKAGTSYTVSLEAKNSDAGQTSVIDYCNIFLQIGTSSIAASMDVAVITGIPSLNFMIRALFIEVWSSAVDNITFDLMADTSFGVWFRKTAVSTFSSYNAEKEYNTIVNSYLRMRMLTDNAANPAIINQFDYARVWFE